MLAVGYYLFTFTAINNWPVGLINSSKINHWSSFMWKLIFKMYGCKILLQLYSFRFRTYTDHDSSSTCQGCHTAVLPQRASETWQINGVLIIGCRECVIVKWSVEHKGLRDCLTFLVKWNASVNSSGCGNAEWDKPWYFALVFLYFHLSWEMPPWPCSGFLPCFP